MSDKIEKLLDNNGKGVLTPELHKIFVANGCEPTCHICENPIKVGDKLHLKTFFSKIVEEDVFEDGTEISVSVDRKSKTTSSIEVMICISCSKLNKKLPEGEANKMLDLASKHGLIKKDVEKTPELGAIKPPFTNYGSGFSWRGGCMIVRENNKINIIG